MHAPTSWFNLLTLAVLFVEIRGFISPHPNSHVDKLSSLHSINKGQMVQSRRYSSSVRTDNPSMSAVQPSDEWEVDVYSRPVKDARGKKLWEILICDSTGEFKHCQALPSNMVNSREVKKAIEKVIDDAPVKPKVVRYFRVAMQNMLNIALGGLDMQVIPSRTTYRLLEWLEQREKEVYPQMDGYNPNMVNPPGLDIRTPQTLPDALVADQYAFVALPISYFRNGEVSAENIGLGKLCPIDPSLPDDTMVQGVVIVTRRAKALAAWMTGLEVAFVRADLKKKEMILEVGISTQFYMVRFNENQRAEAQVFENGKRQANGIHFLAVQKEFDEEEVEGFWLLRETSV